MTPRTSVIVSARPNAFTGRSKSTTGTSRPWVRANAEAQIATKNSEHTIKNEKFPKKRKAVKPAIRLNSGPIPSIPEEAKSIPADRPKARRSAPAFTRRLSRSAAHGRNISGSISTTTAGAMTESRAPIFHR